MFCVFWRFLGIDKTMAIIVRPAVPVQTSRRALVLWLLAVAVCVFIMVIVGAVTRLTESGLSMVEWRPLIGAVPPLSAADWQNEFDLYRQTPEFQKKNSWMEIGDFKRIYFWEWFHRLWGRMIGIIFALPLLYFWLRGRIPPGYGLPMLGLLALGGAQGFMGWYMVQSGLVDIPAVSHYRLAAHLALAFLIFSLLIFMALKISAAARTPSRPLFFHALAGLVMLVVTITWGAFVAGKDAGLIYNEFPRMGAGFMPPDMWHLDPPWLNIFEHIPSIQFVHRWLGVSTGLVIFALGFHALRLHALRGGLPDVRAYMAASLLALVQVGLGIATLLSGVNIVLAALHQATALLLLGALVVCLYKSAPQRRKS